MAKKIGIIGSGVVAQALGAGFRKYGYEVMLGTREPGKLKDWLAGAGKGAKTGSVADTAAFGEIVVLAVKGSMAEAVAKQVAGALKGKTVLDTNNPIADKPPVDGVLEFFTGPNDSLMERLQKAVPEARFVKAFSCIGNAFMVDPKFPGGKPTIFICGNDVGAKKETAAIIEQFGLEVADMGGAAGARAIEPLCILWCIPGLRGNGWNHAFKLLRL